MAIDQLTADCLARPFEVEPTSTMGKLLASTYAGGSDDEHRSPMARQREQERRERQREARITTPEEAAASNARIARQLQVLVDELQRTEPVVERTYELRVVGSGFGGRHLVLLCTDRRVVVAEVDVVAGDVPVAAFAAFPHGVLDVQNKLVKVHASLDPGPPPVLVWPRVAGDDDELDAAVRAVQPGPSPALQRLVAEVRARPAAIRLQAPCSGRAVAAAPASPPAWHPDPRGRHEHRWWDGARWTETVADRGVTAVDPL
jgi:hypothetical protein